MVSHPLKSFLKGYLSILYLRYLVVSAFLGYATNYKGYRCLDPTTGTIYVIHHVIFHENIFPT